MDFDNRYDERPANGVRRAQTSDTGCGHIFRTVARAVRHEWLGLKWAAVGGSVKDTFQATIGFGFTAWTPTAELASISEMRQQLGLVQTFVNEKTEAEFQKYSIANSYHLVRVATSLAFFVCLFLAVVNLFFVFACQKNCSTRPIYGAAITGMDAAAAAFVLVVTHFGLRRHVFFRNYRYTIAFFLATVLLEQIWTLDPTTFEPTQDEMQFSFWEMILLVTNLPPFLRLRRKPMLLVSICPIVVVLVSLRGWDETFRSDDLETRKQWLYLVVTLGLSCIGSILFSFHREYTDRLYFVTLLRFAEEEANSRDILHRLLPKQIADRWTLEHVLGRQIIADPYADVSVIFVRIKHFADRIAAFEDKQVMKLLNKVFTAFDGIVSKHPALFKVETVSEEYVIISGAPIVTKDHTLSAAMCALELMSAAPRFKWPDGQPVVISIGIHSGPVVCGVLGLKLPRFRVFGDTMNTASRMMSTAAPGTIQISHASYLQLSGTEGASKFSVTYLGQKTVKGKGQMAIFQVHMREPAILEEPPEEVGEDDARRGSFSLIGNFEGGAEASNKFPSPNIKNIPTNEKGDLNLKPSEPVAASSGQVGEGQSAANKRSKRRQQKSRMVATWVSMLHQIDPAEIGTRLKAVNQILGTRIRRFGLTFTNDGLEESYLHYFAQVTSTRAARLSTLFGLSILFGLLFNAWAYVPDFLRSPSDVRALRRGESGDILPVARLLYFVSMALFFFLLITILAFAVFMKRLKERSRLRRNLALLVLVLSQLFPTILAFGIDHDEMVLLKPQAIFSNTVIFFLAANAFSLPFRNFFPLVAVLFILMLAQLFALGLGGGEMVALTLALGIEILVSRFRELSQREDFIKQLAIELDSLKNVLMIQRLLPIHAVTRLDSKEAVADTCEDVVMLFADLVGFTSLASELSETEVVGVLQRLFKHFDKLTDKHNVQKVETIGDCYWCSSDIKRPTAEDAQNMVEMAMQMLKVVKKIRPKPHLPPLSLRIGIHVGRVLGGVVGTKMPRYHLFGTHVMIAQSMESNGVVDGINVSGEVVRRLPVGRYKVVERPPLERRDYGTIPMFLVSSLTDVEAGEIELVKASPKEKKRPPLLTMQVFQIPHQDVEDEVRARRNSLDIAIGGKTNVLQFLDDIFDGETTFTHTPHTPLTPFTPYTPQSDNSSLVASGMFTIVDSGVFTDAEMSLTIEPNSGLENPMLDLTQGLAYV